MRRTGDKKREDKLGRRLYCLVDGVLTPMVYNYTDNQDSNLVYHDDLYVTSDHRLRTQQNLKGSKSLVTKIQEGNSQISPVAIFDYTFGFKGVTSDGIEDWLSSVDANRLNQSDNNKRPDVGANNGGVNGFVPANFVQSNFDFFSLTSTVTLSGDFTMFFFIKAIPNPLPKKVRLLGKSDDNDMYFSIGESVNKSYKISFASGSTAEAAISTPYWESHSTKILITVQRKSDALIIRENGTQVFTGTTPTSDFVFDQFGKLGNDGFETFNGNVYHFSAYNGHISSQLTQMEDSIITQSLLATE